MGLFVVGTFDVPKAVLSVYASNPDTVLVVVANFSLSVTRRISALFLSSLTENSR